MGSPVPGPRFLRVLARLGGAGPAVPTGLTHRRPHCGWGMAWVVSSQTGGARQMETDTPVNWDEVPVVAGSLVLLSFN